MQEAFHAGGWGMFPTTIVGFVMIFSAVLFALSPARAKLRLIVGLGVLTILTSLLGFVSGVIKTISSANEIESQCRHGEVVLAGIGESLNNIGLGVCMLVLATVGVCVGLARSPRRPASSGAELVDPLR